MKLLKFDKLARIGLSILFYGIFIYFLAVQLIQAQNNTERLILLLVFTPILLIALWYEGIKYAYRDIIYKYNFKVNIHDAMDDMMKLRRFDFLRGYKNNEILLRCFYYTDTMQPEKLNELLDTHEKKFFRKSLDMLLVYNVSKMNYYQMISNKTQVKKYYESIIQMQGRKVKGKKISPIYNMDALSAQYHLIIGDLKKANLASLNVNTSSCNPKEEAYVYYTRFLIYKGLGKLNEATESAETVIKLGNQLSIVDLCKKELKV